MLLDLQHRNSQTAIYKPVQLQDQVGQFFQYYWQHGRISARFVRHRRPSRPGQQLDDYRAVMVRLARRNVGERWLSTVSRRVQNNGRMLSLSHVSESSVMTHVYFHCTNEDGMMLAPRSVEVHDFVEAHERAAQMVRAFVNSIGPDDWRGWIMHVRDEEGEEIFLMPFSCVLGQPH
jgi:hypothetical protein